MPPKHQQHQGSTRAENIEVIRMELVQLWFHRPFNQGLCQESKVSLRRWRKSLAQVLFQRVWRGPNLDGQLVLFMWTRTCECMPACSQLAERDSLFTILERVVSTAMTLLHARGFPNFMPVSEVEGTSSITLRILSVVRSDACGWCVSPLRSEQRRFWINSQLVSCDFNKATGMHFR